MNPIPSLYFPKETSLLDPRALVEWKRRRGAYSFSSLPSLCLLANPRFFPWSKRVFRSPIRGLPPRSYIRRDILFLPYESNGGAHIISLLEELRILGVEEVLFFGMAGILGERRHQGEVCWIDEAGSGTGVAAYYHSGERAKPFPSRWATLCSKEGDLRSATCFSVDAPFRETPSLIRGLESRGYSLIDMETGPLYAFSRFHSMPLLSVLIGADRLGERWQPPDNLNNLFARGKEMLGEWMERL